MQFPPKIVIFVDGASSGNPGPGGWGAIISDVSGEVTEIGGPGGETTNNRMELTASIEALRASKSASVGVQTQVYSDSKYVILGITEWIFNWTKKNWVSASGKPVANIDLWKSLREETSDREVRWSYVPAHRGIPGNERADQIAVSYTRGKKPILYRGQIQDYGVDIFSQLPEKNG